MLGGRWRVRVQNALAAFLGPPEVFIVLLLMSGAYLFGVYVGAKVTWSTIHAAQSAPAVGSLDEPRAKGDQP